MALTALLLWFRCLNNEASDEVAESKSLFVMSADIASASLKEISPAPGTRFHAPVG
jgi:hypothetical protein